MFGLNQQAKVPNSSQYDFKGASVYQSQLRSSLLLVLTSQLLLGREIMDQLQEDLLADLSRTKVVVFRINCKTKQMSLKEQNIEQLWQLKIQTILNKTLKNWKKKSMFCWRSVWFLRLQVYLIKFRSKS